jgi:DNA-binding transcriptional regulator YdaS (Cro superfamily)
VSRKEIRAALKVVMANRTPEIERLVRGEATAKELARLANK